MRIRTKLMVLVLGVIIGMGKISMIISINSMRNQLSSVAKEIGNITEVVTELSAQTNLLALNTTIEGGTGRRGG